MINSGALKLTGGYVDGRTDRHCGASRPVCLQFKNPVNPLSNKSTEKLNSL
jgi:hypothetical protein